MNAQYGATSRQLMPDGFYPPPTFPRGVNPSAAVKMAANPGTLGRWELLGCLRAMGLPVSLIGPRVPDAFLAEVLRVLKTFAGPPHHYASVSGSAPHDPTAGIRERAIAGLKAHMAAIDRIEQRDRVNRVLAADPVGRLALARLEAERAAGRA